MATLPIFSFPCSLLVSAECRLTPWTIPLIVMGVLAIGATLVVGPIVTIVDGITVCHLYFCKKNQTCTECCSNISKDIKEGELSL